MALSVTAQGEKLFTALTVTALLVEPVVQVPVPQAGNAGSQYPLAFHRCAFRFGLPATLSALAIVNVILAVGLVV